MTKPRRPIMRYHGGKFTNAKWIVSHFPKHRIYVEPFGGAASVLLHKQRVYSEVYNDINSEIVNVFRVLRDPDLSEHLIQAITLTPYARDEFDQSYEQHPGPVEQARRTIARSFMSFGAFGANGKPTGFRTGFNRSGTTSAKDWRNYPDHLKAIIDRLRGVTIENLPAIEVMQKYDSPDTFFYLDPPYPHGTRGTTAQYAHEMTDDDHRQMIQVARDLQGKVTISGYACDLYDKELLADWERIEQAALADSARKRTEVLWFSPGANSQPRLI